MGKPTRKYKYPNVASTDLKESSSDELQNNFQIVSSMCNDWCPGVVYMGSWGSKNMQFSKKRLHFQNLFLTYILYVVFR